MQTESQITLIVSIIGAIPGIGAIVWQLLKLRKDNSKTGSETLKNEAEARKTEADITDRINAIADKTMEKMQRQIDMLDVVVSKLRNEADNNQEEIRKLKDENITSNREICILKGEALMNRREIERLTKGVNILIAQIRKRGEKPDWTPDDIDLLT